MELPSLHPSRLRRLFLCAEEPRLRAGWRLLGQTFLLLIGLVVFSIPLGIFWSLFPGLTEEALTFLATGVLFLSATASVFVARRLLDRRSFASLGLRWNGRAAADLLIGFLISGAMIGVIFLVEAAAGWLRIEGFAWQSTSVPYLAVQLAFSVIAFLMVGWHEELLARGYWLQNLSEGLNLYWGVALSSALFALAHVANPNVSWEAILGLFFAGLFLAFGYLRTGQLWLPIGLHFGWNLFEGTVFGFPVSGTEYFRLLRQTALGPELVTGGDFGPEAGLIQLPALLLGTAAILWYTEKRNPEKGEA